MTKTSLRTLLTVLALVCGASIATAQMAPNDPLYASREALVPGAVIGAPVVSGEIYVPTHSSIRAGDGRTRVDLAVTLSIHNAAEDRPLALTRIDYHDGAGRLVQRHLAAPVLVRPFGTVEIFVAKNDVRGGTGSNFIVGWSADGDIAEPVVEAVMIGDFANQSYSFVSNGRRVERTGPRR